MVVTDPPVGWSNAQDQLKWVWKILASSYVHDTEAWIEISRSNDFFIQSQQPLTQQRSLMPKSSKLFNSLLDYQKKIFTQNSIYQNSEFL
ncbi:hypothetical protein [Nostoc sp.]|uniref:hypothetical protein n=1 Tax=Nostoc sp. TaxID=1180 RepID=UPI002FFC6B09